MFRLWRTLFIPVILGFIFLGIYLYFHLGAQKGVEIELHELPAQTLLYKEHRGAYHQINSVIETVESWAKAHQIPCPKTFGRYLDDPLTVAEDRLRSEGGCVLGTPLTEVPEGFRQDALGPGSFIKATFKGSPAIGPWKVYPRIRDYIAEKRLKTAPITIEVYQIESDGGMTTTYLVPTL